MNQQIVSEFRKLRTTRTAWGLLAGLLALVAPGSGACCGTRPAAATLVGPRS